MQCADNENSDTSTRAELLLLLFMVKKEKEGYTRLTSKTSRRRTKGQQGGDIRNLKKK